MKIHYIHCTIAILAVQWFLLKIIFHILYFAFKDSTILLLCPILLQIQIKKSIQYLMPITGVDCTFGVD